MILYLNESLRTHFDAVIFDMDGLVLDTEPSYTHAWQLAAARFGVQLEDDFLHGLFGRHAADVWQALAERMGENFDQASFHELAESHWRRQIEKNGIATMPGLTQILDLLEQMGIAYALATNSESRYAEMCLERAGIAHRFRLRVCRDDVAEGKPAPDVFIEAANRLGTAVEDCLILEDSLAGVLAARNANALPILVSGKQVSGDLRKLALAVFPSLTALAERLRSL